MVMLWEDNQLLMTVNKITLTIPRNQDRILNIPVQLDWELLDTENEINMLQSQINAEVAGRPIDFETDRFSHSGVTDTNNVNVQNYDTSLNYEFYFFLVEQLMVQVQHLIGFLIIEMTDSQLMRFTTSHKDLRTLFGN